MNSSEVSQFRVVADLMLFQKDRLQELFDRGRLCITREGLSFVDKMLDIDLHSEEEELRVLYQSKFAGQEDKYQIFLDVLLSQKRKL